MPFPGTTMFLPSSTLCSASALFCARRCSGASASASRCRCLAAGCRGGPAHAWYRRAVACRWSSRMRVAVPVYPCRFGGPPTRVGEWRRFGGGPPAGDPAARWCAAGVFLVGGLYRPSGFGVADSLARRCGSRLTAVAANGWTVPVRCMRRVSRPPCAPVGRRRTPHAPCSHAGQSLPVSGIEVVRGVRTLGAEAGYGWAASWLPTTEPGRAAGVPVFSGRGCGSAPTPACPFTALRTTLCCIPCVQTALAFCTASASGARWCWSRIIERGSGVVFRGARPSAVPLFDGAPPGGSSLAALVVLQDSIP